MNNKNFVPVSVLKHCSLKFSVSSTSIPEGGSGRSLWGTEDRFVWWESGCNRVVIAWTPWKVPAKTR